MNFNLPPIIHTAIDSLNRVEAVQNVKPVGDIHWVNKERGIDIELNGMKVFLPMRTARDLITFPLGGFHAVEFVNTILKPESEQTQLFDDGDQDV